MVHNVTLYEARDAIGDTWISTIWRCHRVLLRCLCCGVGNPEKNVVICSIVLDEEPPTEQVRSLSRALSLSFSLSLQLHTLLLLNSQLFLSLLQIMAYIYGTIKPELADRMHTLHRLQVDGLVKTVDGLGLDISGASRV